MKISRILSTVLMFALLASSFGAPVIAQTPDANTQPAENVVADETKTDDINVDDKKPADPNAGDPGDGQPNDGEPQDGEPKDPEGSNGDNPNNDPENTQDPNDQSTKKDESNGSVGGDLKPLEMPAVKQMMADMGIMALDSFPSTNDNNKTHNWPYVELDSAAVDSVTLNFVNPTGIGAPFYFEYRVDGVIPDGRPSNYNPCKESAAPLPTSCDGKRYIADDDIAYPTYSVSANTTRTETIPANSKVEVRMTFGPERDYDFDWVPFEVIDAPDAPTLISPANGATVPGASVTQSWSSVSDAHHYIYESYHNETATDLRWHEEFTTTSKTATNVADATYWWRVKAVDDDGNESPWSELWKLTVDNSPDTTRPTLIFLDPATDNQVYDQTVNVTVEALDSQSGLNNLVVHFKDTVANSKAHLGACGAGLPSLGGTTASTTYTCALDVSGYPEGTYFLRAGTFDTAGNNKTVERPIVIDHSGPTAPQIIFPSNGQVFPSQPILNDWTESTDSNGIQKYEIEYVYSDGHTFAGGPYRTTAGNVTQRNHVPGMGEQGGVTIRVRAYDNNGNVSDWSNSVYYIYDNPTDGSLQSRIIEPTDGEVTNGTTDLIAHYLDQNGDKNDGVQWAVRKDVCTAGTGTVAGNVDGHSDSATWNGTDFSFAFDTTAHANGTYCFVFNPTEDSGNMDQRLTRVFTIDNVVDPGPGPTPQEIDITGNTSAGENQLGWLFNRDQSTKSPYEFNSGAASLGLGSLFVEPITNTGNGAKDKFIAELFLLTEVGEVNSISYDFQIDAPNASVDDHFYMNVYMNFAASDPTKFYDCRYNVVPASGALGSFTTVTFDPTLAYPVTQRSAPNHPPQACPTSPAAMGSDAIIRAIAINVGDESLNDQGISGYLDKVVVDTDSSVTIYDFEPVPPTPSFTGGGGGGSFVAGTPTSTGDEQVLGASTDEGMVLGATCPLITSFMKEGAAGDSSQVSALQTFLNGELGINLLVNGTFDAVTTLAVKAFQLKYQSEVLMPWGPFGMDPIAPTGYVYKTTAWKINDIACPDLEQPEPELP